MPKKLRYHIGKQGEKGRKDSKKKSSRWVEYVDVIKIKHPHILTTLLI